MPERSEFEPLPPIPAKRYFTIGEVAQLCCVKPHVLRYWEQEFTQLRPIKRRGNRRYYQHHEVLLVRRIRDLLYHEGFTISGARHRLDDGPPAPPPAADAHPQKISPTPQPLGQGAQTPVSLSLFPDDHAAPDTEKLAPLTLRNELRAILNLLRP
jgi:DNA-binding transcriptional MerR regulator